MAGSESGAEADRFLELVQGLRVLPVVELSSPEQAVQLASVLAEAGLPLMEITLRTPAAAAAIRAVRDSCPNILVGAGTILDPSGLQSALAAGAQFGVSPGFDPRLASEAFEATLAYVPGVATASEVQAALGAGHRLLKFFPAEAAGGTAALRGLGGVFGPAGVRFIPTGGIRQANAADYLELAQVAAVGGTWIAPRQDLEAGDWEAIHERARAAGRFAA